MMNFRKVEKCGFNIIINNPRSIFLTELFYVFKIFLFADNLIFHLDFNASFF